MSLVNKVYDIYGQKYYQYDYYYYGDDYYNAHSDYFGMIRCRWKEPEKWVYDYGGGVRTMNSLPIRTDSNLSDREKEVIAIQTVLATLIMVVNILCIVVIHKKKNLGKSVRFIIYLDIVGRLYEGVTFYYKASCQITWHCVKPHGFLIAPIMLNRILTALGWSLVSMLLLLHCLSVNRVLAVFFDGRYYEQVQRLTFPYTTFCFVAPLIFQLVNVRDLVDAKTQAVCYAGFYYDPSSFMAHLTFHSSPFYYMAQTNLAYFMGVFLVIPVLLDVVTVIWIRAALRTSQAQKRADLRLSVMMLINCLIWVADILMHYYLFTTLPGELGYFLTYEISPAFGHCILCVITILFNVPSWKCKRRVPTVKVSINSLSGSGTTT